MGVLILSAIWGLASLIGLAANCIPETMLTIAHPRQCPEQVRRLLDVPLPQQPLFNIKTDLVSPLADHNSIRHYHRNIPLLFACRFRMVEYHVVVSQISSLPCFCISPAIDRPFCRPPQPLQAIHHIDFTTIRDIRQPPSTTSHAHLLTYFRDYTKPQELHEIIFNGAWRSLWLHGQGSGRVV